MGRLVRGLVSAAVRRVCWEAFVTPHHISMFRKWTPWGLLAAPCGTGYGRSAYKALMSDSHPSTPKQKSPQNQKNPPLAHPIAPQTPEKPAKSPVGFGKVKIDDSSGVYEENRQLRRKLKELSGRLDESLARAAEERLRQGSQRIGHPVTAQSQSLQLQNAYKMIERLQKTVHDYESKEMYHVTLKRVMDLEGIIKKKDEEIEELKIEIKTQKRIVKDRDRHIEELIEHSKKLGNPTEDLEVIAKLRAKIKKLTEEGESLRRKELEKHEKLSKAERRVMELEQEGRRPLLNELEGLQKELEDSKTKYRDAIQRLERQNIYIGKLNEKLAHPPSKPSPHKPHNARNHYSMSLEELPKISKREKADSPRRY